MIYIDIVVSLLLLIIGLNNPIDTTTQNPNCSFVEYEVPQDIDTSFKAYMDYRTITDETTLQWQLQQEAYTDKQGFRRIDNDYIIALGTYYEEQCGSRFRITLDSGIVFSAIVGDIKSPIHTDKLNMYRPVKDKNNKTVKANVIEFLVDTDIMDETILSYGTVCDLGFEGQVIKIEKIERIIEFEG